MEKYSDSIESRWTGRYDASLALVGDVTGKRILDIGCSFGWFEKAVVKGENGRIYGIDINREQLVRAAFAVPEAGFIQATVPQLPFKKQIFDIVVIWETIEHLPKDMVRLTLESIRYVLKPQGRLFCPLPNRIFARP